jgi:Fe-S cluster biogenesis protein NfuA
MFTASSGSMNIQAMSPRRRRAVLAAAGACTGCVSDTLLSA